MPKRIVDVNLPGSSRIATGIQRDERWISFRLTSSRYEMGSDMISSVDSDVDFYNNINAVAEVATM
jgi:hypothetical protein